MITSFLVWVVLTTVIPQTLIKYANKEIQSGKFLTSGYPYLSLLGASPIQNSDVYYVIGHPDDEVMFFAPSLIELAKPKNNNTVNLICFSNGDATDESMGHIRTAELVQSARILGVHSDRVTVLGLDQYKDGMNIQWDAEDITKTLESYIDHTSVGSSLVVITFDDKGVSGHPNHISLYHGVRRWYNKNFTRPSYHNLLKKNVAALAVAVRSGSGNVVDCKIYGLKSLNFWEKYSFTVLTNVELFVEHLSKLIISNILKFNVNISFFNPVPAQPHTPPPIMFYSDLNMLSVAYAAMSYGHFLQMVWFRYGWLLLSRYLTFNQLIPI